VLDCKGHLNVKTEEMGTNN